MNKVTLYACEATGICSSGYYTQKLYFQFCNYQFSVISNLTIETVGLNLSLSAL